MTIQNEQRPDYELTCQGKKFYILDYSKPVVKIISIHKTLFAAEKAIEKLIATAAMPNRPDWVKIYRP